MLLQLFTLAKIPGTDCIIQTSGPQLRTVGGYIDARGAVRVTLKLSDKCLILQVPYSDIAIAATAEADLRIGRDRQSVTRRCRRGQFSLDSRRGTCQIPNAQLAGLSAN